MKQTDKVRRYVRKDWGFSIAYPVDWEVVKEDELDRALWIWAVAIVGDSTKTGRPAVSVYVRPRPDPGENSLVGYVEQAQKELENMFSGFRFHSAEQGRLSTAPTSVLSYSYDGGEERITERNITVCFPQKLYRIICEAPDSVFPLVRPIFDNMVDSFQVFPAGTSPINKPVRTKSWWQFWK